MWSLIQGRFPTGRTPSENVTFTVVALVFLFSLNKRRALCAHYDLTFLGVTVDNLLNNG